MRRCHVCQSGRRHPGFASRVAMTCCTAAVSSLPWLPEALRALGLATCVSHRLAWVSAELLRMPDCCRWQQRPTGRGLGLGSCLRCCWPGTWRRRERLIPRITS